ncbi:hypothetical protein COY28_07070, partial [Candidatus Woesearchaeota archaeon CG_4_10_14_0_2_um_filter_57_5]
MSFLLVAAMAPQFALADASPAPAPAATAQTLANVLDALYNALEANIPSAMKQAAQADCNGHVHLQAFGYSSSSSQGSD